jgi:hypothetical protein
VATAEVADTINLVLIVIVIVINTGF